MMIAIAGGGVLGTAFQRTLSLSYAITPTAFTKHIDWQVCGAMKPFSRPERMVKEICGDGARCSILT